MMSPAVPGYAKKITLALFAVLVALVFLEVGLQAGSLFVRDTNRSSPLTKHTLRVLCLGDSNTYGLSVPREQSYPSQLEALWRRRDLQPPIEVFNLGYPGTNSSQVLRDFERNLALFQPDVVIVEVGNNDFWTLPVATQDGPPSLGEWLRRSSRVYKLLYMATRRIPDASELIVTEDPDTNVERGKGSFEFGGQVFDLGHEMAAEFQVDAGARLKSNLSEIASKSKADKVALILVGYASANGFHPAAEKGLRTAAREAGVPFVDVRSFFRESGCESEPCPD